MSAMLSRRSGIYFRGTANNMTHAGILYFIDMSLNERRLRHGQLSLRHDVNLFTENVVGTEIQCLFPALNLLYGGFNNVF